MLLGTLALIAPSVGCARPDHNGNGDAPRGVAQTITQSSPSNSTGAAPENSQQPKMPDELVRQFYTWYLGDLRDGKEPFKEEEKMKQYLADDFIDERRKTLSDTRFDPVLLLPNSDSGWRNMTVEVAKPKFYKGKGYYDAYVDVTYKQHGGGRDFDDEWVIGLQRRGAGWRIASISIKE